jgi:hypothetical protein
MVRASRGVPETVTVSDIFRVKEIEFPGTYVAFAGPEADEIVGAVRSMMIVFADVISLGPVWVAVIELALSWRIKFPAVQLVTVTV